MPGEVYACKAFVASRLDAALAIPVEEMGAASGLTAPYCLYQIDPEMDLITGNRHTVLVPFDVVVRIVGKGYIGPLRQHVRDMEEALHLTSGPTADGYVASCRRIAPFRLPPFFVQGSNTPTQSIGARFRILVSPLE